MFSYLVLVKEAKSKVHTAIRYAVLTVVIALAIDELRQVTPSIFYCIPFVALRSRKLFVLFEMVIRGKNCV